MINSSLRSRFGLLFVVVAISAAALGLGGLKTSANYQVYFDPDDPLLRHHQSLQREFHREDSMTLIVDGLNSVPNALAVTDFDPLDKSLRALQQVEDIRGFYDYLVGGQGGSPGELIMSPGGEPYLSRDGYAGLVEIDVRLKDKSSAAELYELSRAIRTIVDANLPAGLNVQYSGPLALNLAYADVIKHDLRVFVPGLLLLTCLVLYLFLRHLVLCASALLLGLLPVVTAYGISGWSGFELAAINAFGPIIIISLSIATQMHLVLGYLRHLALDKMPGTALADSMLECRRPFLLSCLSTAAGFLCLLSSPSPPVQKLGITVALGVAATALVGLVILPRVLLHLELSGPKQRFSRWQHSLSRLTRSVGKRRVWVILVAVALGLPSLYLLKGLVVDDSVYRYFPKSHNFSQGIATLDQRFDGSVHIQFELDSGRARGILSAEFVASASQFHQWLARQPEVELIVDPLNILEDMGFSLSQPAQLDALFRAQPERMQRYFNGDYSSVLVTAVVKSASALALIEFNDRASLALHEVARFDAARGGSGPDLIFANLGQRNAVSMFLSLGIALLAITVVLAFFFRSVHLGFIALLCNSLPVVVVYGLWVLFGGSISLGSAVVMGMILGIIVDDTIHMLYGYQRNPQQSIVLATGEVGPALVFSSLALAAGLAVGLLSDFRPIWELSLLSLAIILAAMLTDLLVLPAMLGDSTSTKNS